MQRRALLLTASLLLLVWVAYAAGSIADLQKKGFYMIGAEGNTTILYGADCNAEINAPNTVIVHHVLFTAVSETNGEPDVSCDSNAIYIANAVKTTIISAKCNPDTNALPTTVRCGGGCKIASAEPYEKNGWFIHLTTWGEPEQICLDGKCAAVGGGTEFNIPGHEGNNEITILCGAHMDTTTVVINPPSTKKEIKPKPVKTVAEEGNIPITPGKKVEVNAAVASVKKTRWINLGIIRVKLRRDTNAWLDGNVLILKNGQNRRLTLKVEPTDPTKKYYAERLSDGKRKAIPGRLPVAAKSEAKWKIFTQVPPIKKVGEHIVIEGKKPVTVDVNADSFQVAPTNVPGAPGKILAMFSFEKNVPAGGSVTVKIAVPGNGVELWKYDGKTWKTIPFKYKDGWAIYSVKDNGPLDQDPTAGQIVDDVAVGTNDLEINANVTPQVVDLGGKITISGTVEKNGVAVADNWANIRVDGARIGGPYDQNGPAHWWNLDWKYRREINISNPSGLPLTDYPVVIRDVNLVALYDEGKLRYDAGDIRFADINRNELNYWIAPVKTSSIVIPQASDDTDPTTADAVCDTNPQYHYLVTDTPPSGWYETNYDDENWLIGSAPFGNTGGQCTTDSNTILIRKWFTIPGDAYWVELNVAVTGTVTCYVNGHLVLNPGSATTATYWNYSVKIYRDELNSGDNLLACEITPNSGTVYFDADVNAIYGNRLLQDANIWVLVPYIPPAGTTIYMYYGNPSATSESNPHKVFVFYDDFEGETDLNTAQWSIGSAAYDVNDGVLTIQEGGISSIYIPVNMEGNYIVETRARLDSTSESSYGGTFPEVCSSSYTAGGNANGDATILYMVTSGSGTTTVKDWIGDGSTTSYNITSGESSGWSATVGQWYITAASIYGPLTSSTADIWVDGTVMKSHSGISWAKEMHYIRLGGFSSGTTYDIKDTSYDWVRVRKYVNPEPVATISSTEYENTVTDSSGHFAVTIPTPTTIGKHIVDIDVNDGTDYVNIEIPFYVRSKLRINWADTLPRVQNGYPLQITSSDTTITDVNGEIVDSTGTATPFTCTTSDYKTWTCDLNMHEFNIGKYTIEAFGYASGALTGFDAKITDVNSAKDMEFSTDRDVNEYSDVVIQPESIKLLGILAGFNYRRPITIDNSGGPAYSAVPVKVVVDTAALIAEGKMKSDCSDVRFTDSDG
ncbi:MAG: DUF2341 domain-containing protein, partial [Candidatus Diapherotrites archaeon]|nr:DUF2341 domain-containing protein [Candidatus Diapherotrites archaeon]